MSISRLQVSLSCIGKFHHFDLARQLDKIGWLKRIHTGYPRWKLSSERLDWNRIDTFPWVHAVYMSQHRWPVRSELLSRNLGRLAASTHDSHVARTLEPCDVFVGLSGHNLKAGCRARELGARWICDRGSTHIGYQDQVLREECRRWQVSGPRVQRWSIDTELAEYESCDLITVPSTFAEKTFLDAGVRADKLRRVAYGVDVSRFYPTAVPRSGDFDVVFVGSVGVRKGIPYLVDAFRGLVHPRKRLTIIGSIDSAFGGWVRKVRDTNIRFLGPIPQLELKEHLSRSHVFVLPSVEEGLALVQAQAMACGCPIICTENTGGGDLITSGIEGFEVPARSSQALTERMQQLADSQDLQAAMRSAALAKVKEIGGWEHYGIGYSRVINELLARYR